LLVLNAAKQVRGLDEFRVQRQRAGQAPDRIGGPALLVRGDRAL